MKRVAIGILLFSAISLFAIYSAKRFIAPSDTSAVVEQKPVAVVPPYIAPKMSSALLSNFADRRLPMDKRFMGDVLSTIPNVSNASDIAGIVAVLKDPLDGDSVRNEAANILSRSNTYEFLPALLHVLQNPEEKPRFRSFATQHLGSFLTAPSMDAQQTAFDRMRELLSDKDVEVQREALWALVKSKDPTAEARAIQWLNDPAPSADSTRDIAIRSVIQMNRREFLPRLRELASPAQSENTRIAALNGLSAWNDDQSRTLFAEASKDKIERIQRAGTAALQRMDSLDRLVPPSKQTVEELAKALRHERLQIRNEAAIALLRFKQDALPALPALNEALLRLQPESKTPHIVAYLDVLRNLGPSAKEAAIPLAELMAERASIYKDRKKPEVHRLRSYIVLTLSDIGSTETALPFIVDALANSDDEMVFNFAASARAAGRLGPQAAPLVPLLTRPLANLLKDSAITLESYHAPLTPTNKTSARLEAIRALTQIGPGAAGALPFLESITQSDAAPTKNLPDCRAEARKAMAAIKGTAGL